MIVIGAHYEPNCTQNAYNGIYNYFSFTKVGLKYIFKKKFGSKHPVLRTFRWKTNTNLFTYAVN